MEWHSGWIVRQEILQLGPCDGTCVSDKQQDLVSRARLISLLCSYKRICIASRLLIFSELQPARATKKTPRWLSNFGTENGEEWFQKTPFFSAHTTRIDELTFLFRSTDLLAHHNLKIIAKWGLGAECFCLQPGGLQEAMVSDCVRCEHICPPHHTPFLLKIYMHTQTQG